MHTWILLLPRDAISVIKDYTVARYEKNTILRLLLPSLPLIEDLYYNSTATPQRLYNTRRICRQEFQLYIGRDRVVRIGLCGFTGTYYLGVFGVSGVLATADENLLHILALRPRFPTKFHAYLA